MRNKKQCNKKLLTHFVFCALLDGFAQFDALEFWELYSR